MIQRTTWTIFFLLCASATLADTVFKDPFEALVPIDLRIEITPGAKLFTALGQWDALSARVLDENNQEVDAPVFWKSSNESVVTIDEFGVIESVASIGSAHVFAEADGAISDVIIVTIVDPADEAILIEDQQVVGMPEAVDPDAEFGIGYEYTVTLTGLPQPNIGDVLIGTGETPIAGRVVEISAVRDTDTTVKLQVTHPDELFDELLIDESINLERVSIEIELSSKMCSSSSV